MRKVVGIGETILDILFKNNQPVAAVPGGSCFNSIISLGRTGIPTVFVGYTGDDKVGRDTASFLRDNGVSSEFFCLRQNEKSAVSLAFLDENGDADYMFYKSMPMAGEELPLPEMNSNDVMLFGSFYAASEGTRPQVSKLLNAANASGSIVYYDLNFRKSHAHELEELMPTLIDNFRKSTIVRGSADDFEVMYGERDARTIYRKHIKEYCDIFICTSGPGQITVCTPEKTMDFSVPQVKTVSTVGAGDNFNAGFVFSLIRDNVDSEALRGLSEEGWTRLVETGCAFASQVCQSQHNSISKEFAATQSL